MILVAGIGNVFRGDDGFGVAVVRRAKARAEVAFVDFGIRGFDLAFALSNGPEAAILVDASARGKTPGTITVLEPHEIEAAGAPATHGMHPLKALALARQLGPIPSVLRVVACEPRHIGSEDDVLMELSPEVEAAVPVALDVIDALLDELRRPPCDA